VVVDVAVSVCQRLLLELLGMICACFSDAPTLDDHYVTEGWPMCKKISRHANRISVYI
jgi:hypothetical protein